MEKSKLVILDGNSLLNRAFYALPPMTNSSGQPTGAIYGFTTMLFKIFQEIDPDYIAAAFDKKAPTFRHIEYAEYKAGRKKMPDELALQFEPLKRLLKAFHVDILEIEGYEADDIIGTMSKRFESPEMDVIIYTGDRDALQLVSDFTNVMITRKGITEVDIYDPNAIKEKYGLTPSGIIDLKGLMGDASDNIPGVEGVGEKTALKLLQEFNTLENVFNNIDKISGKKLKENLELHKEEAFFSKWLATIDRNVPISIELANAKVKEFNAAQVKEMFLEFEFRSLLDRIKTEEVEINSTLPPVSLFDGNKEVINKISADNIFNFIMLFEAREFKGMVLEGGLLVPENRIEIFKDLFQSETIKKNTFGAKKAYSYLKKKNIALNSLDFDFEIGSYLLNPSESSYEISNILRKYAGITIPDVNNNENASAMSLFVDNMADIKKRMLEEIDGYHMKDLLFNVEIPLIEVLAEMESEGFKVNKETLHQIGFELSEEIDSLTVQIYDLAQEEFNINSTKQLGVVLFEKLGLPVIKKTKTGYSTDAEVLEELSEKHEIIEKILSYRQLVKLKSTYIDGLIANISDDGKIHSSFNQTVTATGRISSTEPNMQNIPIKMEQGRKIRKAFAPESEDCVILSADYSQVELRVLAHISEDANLIDAFKNNQDIHRRTASEVLNIPMEEVTTLDRSRAKAVNFGIVYGLSDYGLAKDLKITRKEAKKYIDSYFERYRGVKEYLDNAVAVAHEKGFVKTLMNRIRFIPEINSSNRNVKLFGERLAMNTPIQGTAADIIKIAMVNVYKKLKHSAVKSKLILQVHDELVLEVYKNELEYVKNIVREEMENALKLEVPLLVDINWGNNWYEAK